ncbi:hypothetical protein OUZ56_026965 [Daphnia magna]|uniref:Uncharacterized protein n=1 Tax=Daphnia magna TaxID=35525 RepID=A0ABQ9ZND0_9CRUS|nr:hypothetical protein OUZ56_026965 [Daphnia magna]
MKSRRLTLLSSSIGYDENFYKFCNSLMQSKCSKKANRKEVLECCLSMYQFFFGTCTIAQDNDTTILFLLRMVRIRNSHFDSDTLRQLKCIISKELQVRAIVNVQIHRMFKRSSHKMTAIQPMTK